MKKFAIGLAILILLSAFFAKVQKDVTKADSIQIQGIIIPHHALAKEILNLSFKRLAENVEPKTIVVYGTNHYFPLSETFTTTSEVKDKYRLENFLDNNERIQTDHSIGTALPYLKYYFPESKIVPILISARFSSFSDLEKQVKEFTNYFDAKTTLYVASVDFAHDVSMNEGLKNNTESIEAIKNLDYKKILGFGNEHLDSPLAITTLLMTMENLHKTNWETWYSSHGALIVGKEDTSGTSYVVGVFN